MSLEKQYHKRICGVNEKFRGSSCANEKNQRILGVEKEKKAKELKREGVEPHSLLASSH